MRRFTAFGLLILLLTALPVSAMELGLEDCLRLSVENDREVKAAQAREEARGEEVAAARKNFLPALRMDASYTLLDRPNRLIIDADAFGPGLPPRDVDLYGDRRFRSASLVLEQPLYRGGALRQELERTQRLEAQAGYETKRRADLARRDAEELFLGTLNAQLQRESLVKNLESRRERLRILREQRAEGYAQEEDLLRQQSELAFAEAEAQRARIREKVAVERLKNALYLDKDTALTLRPPRHYQRPKVMDDDTSLTDSPSRADSLALEQQVLAADSEVRKARARLYPEISLFGQYTRQEDNNLDRDEVWSTGAVLEWTIFEWGKNLAEVRRAQAERLRLTHQRAAHARGISDEVDELWGKVREKTLLVDAWELKIRLNRASLQRVRAEFEEGRSTLADVLAREAELHDAYYEYRREINELGVDLAYLRAALGSPLDEWLEEREILPLEEQPQPPSPTTMSLPPPIPTIPEAEPPPGAQSPLSLPAPSAAMAHARPPGHSIQLGAFTDPANAQALKDRAGAAFPEHQMAITRIDGTYKVLIARTEDREQARALLPVIRRKLTIDGFLPRSDP
ncbi:MAG: TolC family protein [Trichloromonas sp.]|nr:TolC family protein [Trichloromonas sp.]